MEEILASLTVLSQKINLLGGTEENHVETKSTKNLNYNYINIGNL
jgi:hypothetical protein